MSILDEFPHSTVFGTYRDHFMRMQPYGWSRCDLLVRIAGEERRFEGDWLRPLLKRLEELETAAPKDKEKTP